MSVISSPSHDADPDMKEIEQERDSEYNCIDILQRQDRVTRVNRLWPELSGSRVDGCGRLLCYVVHL